MNKTPSLGYLLVRNLIAAATLLACAAVLGLGCAASAGHGCAEAVSVQAGSEAVSFC